MCLIRLCGIKRRIPGMGINTDRQTDRLTEIQADWWQEKRPVFAYAISAQTKHLKPFSASLLLFFLLSISNRGWSPTWSADLLGPSRRQTEQEQNLGQHSSSATTTTRMLRQLKVRDSPADSGGRVVRPYSLSMNKV